MFVAIAFTLVGLWSPLITGQNSSGDGSGVFDSSSLLNPTASTAVIIAPSTSATGNTDPIPTPLAGNPRDYITSVQSDLFVGMSYISLFCFHGNQIGNQCSCDLTVGSCDPNCCCDVECTDQIGTFTKCIDIRDK